MVFYNTQGMQRTNYNRASYAGAYAFGHQVRGSSVDLRGSFASNSSSNLHYTPKNMHFDLMHPDGGVMVHTQSYTTTQMQYFGGSSYTPKHGPAASKLQSTLYRTATDTDLHATHTNSSIDMRQDRKKIKIKKVKLPNLKKNKVLNDLLKNLPD